MARSIDDIQASIIASVQADTTLAGASSVSSRAIWRLWTRVVATAIGIFEQLLDVFKSNIESTVAAGVPGTPTWLQAMVFKFQYDAVTPQIIQLTNLIPQYPVVDATKCIVTRCSVKTDLSNNVKIKVAKQNPPIALASGEISSLQAYVNTIGNAGISYVVVSANADQIYIAANIYYQGQYASVISANVQAAITAFLASLPFDGSLKISELEYAIKNVQGVNDVVLSSVQVRRDADAFGSGVALVTAQQTIARIFNSVAGYIIPEVTGGQTLSNSLNFISE